MTFCTYYLIGGLNSMGWPKKTGLFIKKERVNSGVLFVAVQNLVKNAIALGVSRPNIAINLFADLFTERDWTQESIKQIWDDFNPHKKICNNPDKAPEETVAPLPLAVSENFETLIEWKFIFQETFQTLLHGKFGEGLVWGLSHPKEASACHKEQQQDHLKKLPKMLEAGLDVRPLENLDTIAEETEEIVNSFQREIRPLVKVPRELLNLPEVKARIS